MLYLQITDEEEILAKPMNHKKYSWPIFLFFSCIQVVFGQDSSTREKQYLHFETAVTASGQINEYVKGGISYVYTSGGFIRIKRPDDFTGLVYKTNFKNSSSGGLINTQQKTQAENILNPDVSLYLLPGSEFFIDILEEKSGRQVYRYVIKRPKLIPKINFYKFVNGQRILFHTSSQSAQYGELSLSPTEKTGINAPVRNDFKNLDVAYRFINLSTRKSVSGILQGDIDDLKLEANTAYELRVNYAVQTELSSIISIKVSHHLYRSVSTYVILAIFILIVAFLLVARGLKNKVIRSEKKQQKMEEAAIRLQSLLNPHFTFNALSSIQGLINTYRIDDANHYLQEFSLLLRETLAKSQNVYNRLDQELEMMRIYIRLEALRFNFIWDIEIDAEINTSEIEIPTLIIQPLIENAVKHGISNLGEKGKLLVSCKKGNQDNSFAVIIEDNGIWLDNISVSGYGLSITEERIRAINKLNNEQHLTLKFNKQPGTQAVLTFDNWIDI
ncbi:hypothetical protein EZ456_04150 [Pedobacter psychrodurus]|uniref:Signal transduction histidine kinase internal region domain-containing protein n=1 Tax=Pedobacter psychrodurus TaxID=2530456 RepID=A0A4R0Q4H1_9SPHI|nr:histidine kinase [Pedobacter psychrodurus]TCD28588.1 hypothetical protein EZ456_04150 [Pedobacter psychrodurus]